MLSNIQKYLYRIAYPEATQLPAEIKATDKTLAETANAIPGVAKIGQGTPKPVTTALAIRTGNEDSKEATEARAREEAAAKAEQEETEATKETNTILGRIADKLVGPKNAQGKRKGGFLGKLGQFFGIGDGEGGISIGKALIGASLVGLIGQAFKNHIWPTIKESFMGRNQDSFVGRFLGGIGEKFTKAKEWFESEGGLKGILTEKVIPKFVEGLQWTASNILAPLTAALVKALPGLIGAAVKGILEGLKMAIFNKDLPGSTNRGSTTIDVSSSIQEIENIRASNTRGSGFKAGGGFGSATATPITTAGASTKIDYDFSKPKSSANTETGNHGSVVMYDE